MHTADPRSMLGVICSELIRMKPGQCCAIEYALLREVPSFDHKGATFTPADRVLENIVGSAWEFSYEDCPERRVVVFRRHENTGKIRYVSPDRRSVR